MKRDVQYALGQSFARCATFLSEYGSHWETISFKRVQLGDGHEMAVEYSLYMTKALGACIYCKKTYTRHGQFVRMTLRKSPEITLPDLGIAGFQKILALGKKMIRG